MNETDDEYSLKLRGSYGEGLLQIFAYAAARFSHIKTAAVKTAAA
ncbi:MAG: hypothetical protein PHI27_06755 [Eubacteriales bacterium]|nr:hypothetical protein [Eubacteriales bacterium]MDD3881934.1 hypothetical protein [Eubacteriales bacterium]MDD4513825.1 hypothetical protein [Eubacteriales bacterium]